MSRCSRLIRECVSLTLYVHWAHKEISQAVMQALEVYRRAVGPQALGLYGDDEGDWRDLDDKGWEFIRQRFLDPRGANIELTGAVRYTRLGDVTTRSIGASFEDNDALTAGLRVGFRF